VRGEARPSRPHTIPRAVDNNSNPTAPCTLIDVNADEPAGSTQIERDDPQAVFLPVAAKARDTQEHPVFKRDRRRKN
jgi:hypothetical protein